MLKLHYEKIILSASFATAVVFVLLLFLSGDGRKPYAESTSSDAFYFETTESGIQTLELSKETALLPGDSITFVPIGDEQEPRKFQISKIILKNRSSLTVGFNDREIEGRLMSGDDVTLDRGWKKSRSPLEIASKQGRASIPLNEVSYILGERLYVFGEEIDELYSEEWNVSLHQAFAEKKDDENETKTERVRWTKTDDDTGDSIYDLFTPPIIYLIDGNLTTSLPEKVEVLEEKTEEFGLSLQSFDKKAYRFRMRGFTNKFPFFEDLDLRVKENRLNPRTRMELNTAYQDNLSGNPGSSSLVKAINEENKLIEVTAFVIQQIKDPKGGGRRPVARAKVKDYQLGTEFEINSLMSEVFAGEIEIILNYSIESAQETIKISDKDIGKVLEFGSRKYIVSEIDLEGKSLLIEKRGPGLGDAVKAQLTLP